MSLRFRVFWLHLLVSATLMSIFAGLTLLIWYAPLSLLTLQGGTKILALMMFIDVVLGPSLTLLIFNPQKKRIMLAFDMLVIIVVQFLAFSYGAWTLYSERPLFLAFVEDRFFVVRAPDANLTLLPKSISIPDFFESARIVNVSIPNTLKMDSLLLRANNNPGFALRSEFYESFPGKFTTQQLTKNALQLSELKKSPETARHINNFLSNLQYTEEQVLFFQFIGRSDKAIAAISEDSATFLGIVDTKL